MGSLGDELTLDLRPSFVPRTISDFLKQVSTIGDVSEKASKLEDFVKELEQEMRKIDVFKRELPLCMLLLHDAILFLKEESKKCSARNIQAVLEEFIPLKKRNRDVDEDNEQKEKISASLERDKKIREKMNWMSSVQLWKTDICSSDSIKLRFPDPKIINRVESERNGERCKSRSSLRDFWQFRENSSFLVKNEKEDTGLSLSIPAMRNPKEEIDSCLELVSTSSISKGRGISASAPNSNANFRLLPQSPPLPQQQAARKQRRCWSPDLHCRFVNALQQLGGSQVATPKQIRELMQVEGLTNDEVKSHLQKYRLHAKKHQHGNSHSNTNTERQSVVVLGANIQNSSETQGGESSKGSSSQSGLPQGPLQPEATTTTATGGDSMEDDGDAKSESFTWKGHNHHPVPLKDHI